MAPFGDRVCKRRACVFPDSHSVCVCFVLIHGLADWERIPKFIQSTP